MTRWWFLNKPNSSPTTHGSEGGLRLASPYDRDIIHLWRWRQQSRHFPPAPPKQSWNKKGEGGTVLCCAPGSFFCVYLPLHGTNAIFSSKTPPRLTGPGPFMPFALIMGAGLSAGKVTNLKCHNIFNSVEFGQSSPVWLVDTTSVSYICLVVYPLTLPVARLVWHCIRCYCRAFDFCEMWPLPPNKEKTIWLVKGQESPEHQRTESTSNDMLEKQSISRLLTVWDNKWLDVTLCYTSALN